MTGAAPGVWILLTAIMIAAILGIAFFLRRFISMLVDKRTLRYQSDLLEKHCEEVENMYRMTRGWRHDYHNHIQTMKAYLAMGRIEELEVYLNELDTDLTTVDTVIKTGNVMVDAILNSKISVAAAKGITVSAKATVPKDLSSSFSEVDICLILGNLMDNATEACMKIEDREKRFIRIYIDVLKGQLYIYIMNAVGEEIKRMGTVYASTKNKEDHGLGLMRIDRVVSRYSGYLERQDEEGVFATEVMLPLNTIRA